MLKRGISIILTFLLLFTTASAFTPTDVVGTPSENAVKLLTNLGIIKVYEDDTFRPNDPVTRAEVSAVLSKFVTYGEASSIGVQNHFVDVDPSHWAYADINLLASVGVISSSSDYKFRPDDTVTFPELFKMIICVLGYQPQAIAMGDYPVGYMNVAARLNLSSGFGTASTNKVKRDNFAIIMSKAVDVNIMKQVGFGDNASYEIEEGTSLLTENMGIYKLKNQLFEATNITAIAGDTAKIGEVIIEGRNYIIGNTDVGALLGQRVNLYYKPNDNDDERTLIYVDSATNNDIIYIRGKQISHAGPKKIEYYENDELSSTSEISLADDFKMIYNGKAYSRYIEEDFTPNFGSLTVIDNNNDGNYDVLFVESFKNIIVDMVSTSEYIISDKFGNGNINVDPEDKNISVTYIQKGAKSSLDNISEGDILSVAESKSDDGKTAIKIVISNEIVDGTVSEISEDYITIGDKVYTISPCFADKTQDTFKVKPNTTGTFYIDYTGAVTAIDWKSTGSGLAYGYLINAQTNRGLNDYAIAKIFTSAAEVMIYEFADNIIYNGKSIKSKGAGKEIVRLFMNLNNEVQPQIIKYEVNGDKKISKVYTVVNKRAGDENALTQDAKVTMGGEGSKFSYSSNVFGFKYAFDELTVIFSVPKDKSDWYNDELYEIRKLSSFAGDDEYAYKAYDVNDVNWVGAAVFETSENETIFSKNSPAMVVNRIVKVMTEDGEEVYKIYGYTQGVMNEFIIKENVDYKYGSSSTAVTNVATSSLNIRAGDYIRYMANSKKEIVSIQKSFSAGSALPMFEYNGNPIKPHVSFETGENSDGLYQVYFGTVERKEGMLTKIKVKSLNADGSYSESERVFNMGRGKFYSYNAQSKTLNLSNAGEILDARAGNYMSRLFIRTRGTEIYDTLIITGMSEPVGWAE